MVGILVNNTVFTYIYNQSVLWNTAVTDSIIKKKSSSVAYHFVWEGVARKEWISGCIKTSYNCLDLITKTVSSGQDRKRNIRLLMHDIYPEDNVGSFWVTFCHKCKRCDKNGHNFWSRGVSKFYSREITLGTVNWFFIDRTRRVKHANVHNI